MKPSCYFRMQGGVGGGGGGGARKVGPAIAAMVAPFRSPPGKLQRDFSGKQEPHRKLPYRLGQYAGPIVRLLKSRLPAPACPCFIFSCADKMSSELACGGCVRCVLRQRFEPSRELHRWQLSQCGVRAAVAPVSVCLLCAAGSVVVESTVFFLRPTGACLLPCACVCGCARAGRSAAHVCGMVLSCGDCQCLAVTVRAAVHEGAVVVLAASASLCRCARLRTHAA